MTTEQNRAPQLHSISVNRSNASSSCTSPHSKGSTTSTRGSTPKSPQGRANHLAKAEVASNPTALQDDLRMRQVHFAPQHASHQPAHSCDWHGRVFGSNDLFRSIADLLPLTDLIINCSVVCRSFARRLHYNQYRAEHQFHLYPTDLPLRSSQHRNTSGSTSRTSSSSSSTSNSSHAYWNYLTTRRTAELATIQLQCSTEDEELQQNAHHHGAISLVQRPNSKIEFIREQVNRLLAFMPKLQSIHIGQRLTWRQLLRGDIMSQESLAVTNAVFAFLNQRSIDAANAPTTTTAKSVRPMQIVFHLHLLRPEHGMSISRFSHHEAAPVRRHIAQLSTGTDARLQRPQSDTRIVPQQLPICIDALELRIHHDVERADLQQLQAKRASQLTHSIKDRYVPSGFDSLARAKLHLIEQVASACDTKTRFALHVVPAVTHQATHQLAPLDESNIVYVSLSKLCDFVTMPRLVDISLTNVRTLPLTQDLPSATATIQGTTLTKRILMSNCTFDLTTAFIQSLHRAQSACQFTDAVHLLWCIQEEQISSKGWAQLGQLLPRMHLSVRASWTGHGPQRFLSLANFSQLQELKDKLVELRLEGFDFNSPETMADFAICMPKQSNSGAAVVGHPKLSSAQIDWARSWLHSAKYLSLEQQPVPNPFQ